MQKKFYIVSFLILFFTFSLFIFNYTYAKYKDKVTGDANINIARWNIKVNNETINNKTILTNKITPVFDENEYIANNVLAPGATGYYDIVIDASESDVAATYLITAENDETSTISDLKVTDYQINDEEKTTYTSPITGDLDLKNTTTIRFYIAWIDDETETMDNEADTNAIIDENAKAIIKNTIEITQKK